mmetsp:Transcript_18714/g.22991  ORF Transcript_18714/g.22991 Transcript_18714/m.22991 type:complete len:546 (-) Transcript_18714:33-1670(-)
MSGSQVINERTDEEELLRANETRIPIIRTDLGNIHQNVPIYCHNNSYNECPSNIIKVPALHDISKQNLGVLNESNTFDEVIRNRRNNVINDMDEASLHVFRSSISIRIRNDDDCNSITYHTATNIAESDTQHLVSIKEETETVKDTCKEHDHSIKNLFKNHKNESYRFYAMIGLTSIMMFAELIVGIMSGSLTLVSDALHMLSDLIALIIGLIAHKVTIKEAKKVVKKNAFSKLRVEIIGALINGVILVTLCFMVSMEAVQRIVFFETEITDITLVLYVGILGLVINVIGLIIFGHEHHGHSHGHSHDNHSENHSHDHSKDDSQNKTGNNIKKHEKKKGSNDHTNTSEHNHKNLNIKGVFLHILADALGSIAVIVSSLLIKYTDSVFNLYIDPTCTLVMILIILSQAVPLVKQSMMILLDKCPNNIDYDNICKELNNIRGVLNIHDLNIWNVKPDYTIGLVHLIVDNNHTQKNKMPILDEAKIIFHNYNIHYSVVQIEYPFSNNNDWEYSANPCFDYICQNDDCLSKTRALSVVSIPKLLLTINK